MTKILFVCMSNSRRSQMAEAIYNKIFGKDAMSAGIDPEGSNYTVDPNVLTALKEIKINTKNLNTKKLTSKMMEDAYKIIAFRCIDKIPEKYKSKTEDWELGVKREIGLKQAERTIEEIRNMRDLIYEKIIRMKSG